MTTAIGATYATSPTYQYKFILEDYATPTPNTLDLSALLDTEPIRISELRNIRASKGPSQLEGVYSGESREMITVQAVLQLPSYDPRDMELQVRQIRDFFEAAPLNEVRLRWVQESNYDAYLDRCHLLELHPVRSTGLPSQAGFSDPPELTLSLFALDTRVQYVETGDPAPATPVLYGSTQYRCLTNDGSAAWSLVNDVTGQTLVVITDKGRLFLRDGFEEYAEL